MLYAFNFSGMNTLREPVNHLSIQRMSLDSLVLHSYENLINRVSSCEACMTYTVRFSRLAYYDVPVTL